MQWFLHRFHCSRGDSPWFFGSMWWFFWVGSKEEVSNGKPWDPTPTKTRRKSPSLYQLVDVDLQLPQLQHTGRLWAWMIACKSSNFDMNNTRVGDVWSPGMARTATLEEAKCFFLADFGGVTLLLWSLGDLALLYVWCWHQICLNSWIVHVGLFRQFESHTHIGAHFFGVLFAFFPWDIQFKMNRSSHETNQPVLAEIKLVRCICHFLRGHRDGFKI